MNFSEAVKVCFSKYVDFIGPRRAARVLVVLPVPGRWCCWSPACSSEILYGIAGLALLLPALAVGARRLHDIGKSGWLQLVGLIPSSASWC